MTIKALTTEDFSPRTYPEARKAFGEKVALTHEQFAALEAKYKAAAFRVNGIHNARMVQRIRDLLSTAIDSGRPFIEWQREILAELDAANIPRPALSRLKFAFEENTRQAYSDARRETLDDPEITEAFAYRQYKTVGNGTAGVRNVRPEHAALHNKVFRWNDSFWNVYTPPWDFGCRCTTIALTAGQVKARKLVVWTYRGGVVRPVNAKLKRKRVKLATNPSYGRSLADFDLKGLAKDLRELFEG